MPRRQDYCLDDQSSSHALIAHGEKEAVVESVVSVLCLTGGPVL